MKIVTRYIKLIFTTSRIFSVPSSRPLNSYYNQHKSRMGQERKPKVKVFLKRQLGMQAQVKKKTTGQSSTLQDGQVQAGQCWICFPCGTSRGH